MPISDNNRGLRSTSTPVSEDHLKDGFKRYCEKEFVCSQQHNFVYERECWKGRHSSSIGSEDTIDLVDSPRDCQIPCVFALAQCGRERRWYLGLRNREEYCAFFTVRFFVISWATTLVVNLSTPITMMLVLNGWGVVTFREGLCSGRGKYVLFQRCLPEDADPSLMCCHPEGLQREKRVIGEFL